MKTAKEIIDRIETRIHDLEHEIFNSKMIGIQCETRRAIKDELTNLANWIEDNEVPTK